jgi:ABC-type multidrug transport system ATPase subunit
MDPYSRRSTWQILQNAREGRVIVVSTHALLVCYCGHL